MMTLREAPCWPKHPKHIPELNGTTHENLSSPKIKDADKAAPTAHKETITPIEEERSAMRGWQACSERLPVMILQCTDVSLSGCTLTAAPSISS